MQAGGRGSPPRRGAHAQAAKRSKAANSAAGRLEPARASADASAGAPRTTPIYQRLPHGPHQLEPSEVVRHQRTRIHGAMIEAVARNGYERTSVKQVITLAGVSRRCFYEQFANKRECFLATFDLIAGREIQRMARACIASEGELGSRLRAAYGAIAQQIGENRKAARLVLLDTQMAGTPGALRVRAAMATCERMLARSFFDAPDAEPLPAPIVRAITGGLQGAIAGSLRHQDPFPADLGEEMLRWTLSCQTPGAACIGELLAARVNARMRELSLASAHRARAEHGEPADERSRVLHEALRLAAMHDYRELTVPQIADEARVPIDAFFELFAGRDECYLTAIETIGERLLAIAADPVLASGDWSLAVRRVIAELLSYLGEHPLHARTIAHVGFAAGAAPAQRILELLDAIASLLIQGAPGAVCSAITRDAIAGALLHTVRCQVFGRRIQLLGVLGDHLGYVVLAPFIGAEAALAALCEVPA